MRWTVLIILISGCAFDSSGIASTSDASILDSYALLDAGDFDASVRVTDATIDAPLSDATPPDADQHPACTLDIECKSQFGPFHCCYVGLPPLPPGVCVEGNIVGGAGCVAADGELPGASL